MFNKRLLYALGFILTVLAFGASLWFLRGNENKTGRGFVISRNADFRGHGNFKDIVIIGTETKGVYVSYNGGVNYNKLNHPALTTPSGKNVSVKKVLPLGEGEFILVTKKHGLLYTKNAGADFVPLNNGLPKKPLVIDGALSDKYYRDITAITCDTQNKNNLFLTTKYAIYKSSNRGETWVRYSRPPGFYNNLLAIAFTSKHGFHLYLGTAYNGVFVQDEQGGKWHRIYSGLKRTGRIAEEIGSIALDPDAPHIAYVGHNFGNGILRLSEGGIKYIKDASGKIVSYSSKMRKWKLIKNPFVKKQGSVELLNDIKNIQFHKRKGNKIFAFLTSAGTVYSKDGGSSYNKIKINRFLKDFPAANDVNTLTIYSKGKVYYSFNDIHLLTSRFKYAVKSKYYNRAKGRRGYYIQTHVAFQKKRLNRLISELKKNNYNMVTIDLKDDFGMVNYHSSLDIVKKVGSDKGTKINLKRFLKTMHDNGIYVVARLVVFKDPKLFEFLNGKYAIYDQRAGKPWIGLAYSKKHGVNYKMKERWTDPFCEFVWKYNVAIAKELEENGVDEVQFDYIRFPTDGSNMKDAKYRHKRTGQQMKDAIESFLHLARRTLKVPISVDIYGANGWYHMGDRIGQDVEMLSEYVDAICPMFYPSHFSPGFLNFPPYEERPYRIYYYGTLRSLAMSYYKVEIRGWLQAFRLRHDAYDRKYYNANYVAYEILGVKHAKRNAGFTFWHSGSKYEIVLSAVKKAEALVAGIMRGERNLSFRPRKKRRNIN